MLSDDKVTKLSHVLTLGLVAQGLATLRDDETKVRREIKRSIANFLKISEDIDAVVRRKLQSFSRKIVEGSPEWEVLYRKFYKEETSRRGMASE